MLQWLSGLHDRNLLLEYLSAAEAVSVATRTFGLTARRITEIHASADISTPSRSIGSVLPARKITTKEKKATLGPAANVVLPNLSDGLQVTMHLCHLDLLTALNNHLVADKHLPPKAVRESIPDRLDLTPHMTPPRVLAVLRCRELILVQHLHPVPVPQDSRLLSLPLLDLTQNRLYDEVGENLTRQGEERGNPLQRGPLQDLGRHDCQTGLASTSRRASRTCGVTTHQSSTKNFGNYTFAGFTSRSRRCAIS